jgi:hypothetical protein
MPGGRCRRRCSSRLRSITIASYRAVVPPFITVAPEPRPHRYARDCRPSSARSSAISRSGVQRIEQLGVGTTFPFQKLEPRRLSAALDVLLRPEVAERAHQIGQALSVENGTEQITDLIERFAQSQGISVGA